MARMAWAKPIHAKGRVDAAGDTLIRASLPEERDAAVEILDNWRSSHAYPLQVMKMTLSHRAKDKQKSRGEGLHDR